MQLKCSLINHLITNDPFITAHTYMLDGTGGGIGGGVRGGGVARVGSRGREKVMQEASWKGQGIEFWGFER